MYKNENPGVSKWEKHVRKPLFEALVHDLEQVVCL